MDDEEDIEEYDEELIDPQAISPSELEAIESMPRGETVRQTREDRAPVDDVAAETAWWRRGSRLAGDEDDLMLDDDDDDWDGDDEGYTEVAEPYRAPPKVGRNEPCPCGSGKKYKKCCGK